MRALQYTAIGKPPEIREVPVPEPGPGEVLLKMTAAGVCHSDEYYMSLPAEKFMFELPLTLGHEGAGIVAGLRGSAIGVKEGDSVAVYGAWGCGNCESVRDRCRELLHECRRDEDPVARLRRSGVHGRVHARPELASSCPARGARSCPECPFN